MFRWVSYIFMLVLLIAIVYVVDMLYGVADMVYRFLATALGINIEVIDTHYYVTTTLQILLIGTFIALIVHIAYSIRARLRAYRSW